MQKISFSQVNFIFYFILYRIIEIITTEALFFGLLIEMEKEFQITNFSREFRKTFNLKCIKNPI